MDEERLYNDQEDSVEDEEQGMFEHFRLNVDVGQTPMRVDKYMAKHLEDTSRHRVQCAIKEGYVRVNDKIAKANLIIRPGDVIRFVMPYRRRGLEILPQDIPLNIVYEDNDFLLSTNRPEWLFIRGTATSRELSSMLFPFIWAYPRGRKRPMRGWGSWCTE